MDIKLLAKSLQGLQTVETIQDKLKISKRTAINYVSMLKKGGFVSKMGGGRKRIYSISPIIMKLEGEPGLHETINKYSNVKLVYPYHSRIHGKKYRVEDAIIEAIKTENYRVIIAAMPLFNHVKDWSLLCRLAKENNVSNKVGALYDLTRTIIRTKRMDKRTENCLKRYRKRAYLIGIKKGREYLDIEKKWNVVIALRRGDLMRLKEW